MEQLDEYIGSQIPLETKQGPALVKIISRKRHSNSTLIGTKNTDPKIDSRIYNVELSDGHYEQNSVNILHESLLSQLDNQGYDTGHIKELCGYRFDSTMISKDKAFITSHNGNKTLIITTKGCHICIRWNDDSTTWVPLSIIKNCEPLLLAEYANRMNINHKSIFQLVGSSSLKEESLGFLWRYE